jgi:hypothetical protein
MSKNQRTRAAVRATTMTSSIHDTAPREIVGRDTTLRFSMQHQAAAFAALEVLESGDVDRVYCDYHDDFVVRRRASKGETFHFYQVKTKAKPNYQWTLREVFALKKSGQKSDKESLKAIQSSFAGKLLLHALTFKTACREVTLLTNVHFNDDVQTAVDELRSGKPASKPLCILIEKLGEIFEVELGKKAALEIASKLTLLPNVKYIGDPEKNFAIEAREAIFQYSEVDLSHEEAAKIASSLLALVQKKSMKSISGLTLTQLDDTVGIGLHDLLSILSVSPQSYRALIAGEDPKPLRTASFIQRRLSALGATDGMIEYASQAKVDWDIWLRTQRHTYLEMHLNFLLQTITEIRRKWMRSGGNFDVLNQSIADAMGTASVKNIQPLTQELVFGGVMADWVRNESA